MKTLEQFWNEHAAWSQATFGTDAERGPIGPLKHLALKVMVELLGIPRKVVDKALSQSTRCLPSGEHRNPESLEELGDLLFLVFDATRRTGWGYDQLVEQCFAKLEINKQRVWGPRTKDGAVEHVR